MLQHLWCLRYMRDIRYWWILRGWEGVEDSVELEDHELLEGWVGPEDLLHLPLFFYYKCAFSHVIIIWYIFSLSISSLGYNNQDLLCFGFEIPDEPPCCVTWWGIICIYFVYAFILYYIVFCIFSIICLGIIKLYMK